MCESVAGARELTLHEYKSRSSFCWYPYDFDKERERDI